MIGAGVLECSRMIDSRAWKFVVLLIVSSCLSGRAECRFQFSEAEVVAQVKPDNATEVSGLAVSRQSPNVFWIHNDGDRDRVFALNGRGELLATYQVSRAMSDFEDIAIGPGPISNRDYLYLGDIGSNSGVRNKIRIYRAPEPQVDPAWAQNPKSLKFNDVDRLELIYPDEEGHDAEGFFVDPVSGDIFVFSKRAGESSIFRATVGPLTGDSTVVLERVGLVSFSNVSAAAISRDGGYIAVRRENAAKVWIRLPGQTVAEALQSEPFDLPVVGPPVEPNGEALCFDPLGGGYYTTSEGANQNIHRFAMETQMIQSPILGIPTFREDRWYFDIRACPGSAIVVEKSMALGVWSDFDYIYLTGGIGSFSDSEEGQCFYRLKLAE